MLRHSYDNCKINQVQYLRQTCDRPYDNLRTNLKIFCESGLRTTTRPQPLAFTLVPDYTVSQRKRSHFNFYSASA